MSMKIGGGLNFVTGPMGAGKTYYAVRRMVASLIDGQYVITNVELLPEAPERIARHYAPASRRKRALIADKVRRYYVYEPELGAAIRYRLPGKGEARGLWVWDEGHNDLNNRSWKERRDRFKTASDTDSLLEWATQLRKLGYVGFLLSQHADNTDAALRRVCNFHIKLQNQREQTRMLGLRVTPWPLFLAVWVPAHTPVKMSTNAMKIERYFLGWHRRLYDTLDLYHGLATFDDLDAIFLPEEGRVPGLAASGAAPLGAPAAAPKELTA